jgi:hypothetical protein
MERIVEWNVGTLEMKYLQSIKKNELKKFDFRTLEHSQKKLTKIYMCFPLWWK